MQLRDWHPQLGKPLMHVQSSILEDFLHRLVTHLRHFVASLGNSAACQICENEPHLAYRVDTSIENFVASE
jgi:hypothetical protein